MRALKISTAGRFDDPGPGTNRTQPHGSSGLCHKRPLVRQNERGVFCGSSGRYGNPDFGAPSADAPDSRVSWPRQSVLNINFALYCPIESKTEIPVES